MWIWKRGSKLYNYVATSEALNSSIYFVVFVILSDNDFSSFGLQFMNIQRLNIFGVYDLCCVFPDFTFLLLLFFLFLVCPNFQINMLLNFKDDKSECPCPEEIRDQLLDFHEDLMTHCGNVFLTYNSFLNVLLID